eukprot:scaffold159014_cov32-Prasinocladus_malaysianus.AAC.2
MTGDEFEYEYRCRLTGRKSVRSHPDSGCQSVRVPVPVRVGSRTGEARMRPGAECEMRNPKSCE